MHTSHAKNKKEINKKKKKNPAIWLDNNAVYFSSAATKGGGKKKEEKTYMLYISPYTRDIARQIKGKKIRVRQKAIKS